MSIVFFVFFLEPNKHRCLSNGFENQWSRDKMQLPRSAFQNQWPHDTMELPRSTFQNQWSRDIMQLPRSTFQNQWSRNNISEPRVSVAIWSQTGRIQELCGVFIFFDDFWGIISSYSIVLVGDNCSHSQY